MELILGNGSWFTVAIVVLVFLVVSRMFRVLREYERGVVFLLGRFYGHGHNNSS